MSIFLLITPHGWFFRRRVPSDLRKILNRRELKVSLRTADKNLAIAYAAQLAGQSSILFRRLREDRMSKKFILPYMPEIKVQGLKIATDGSISFDNLEMDPDKAEIEKDLFRSAVATLKDAKVDKPNAEIVKTFAMLASDYQDERKSLEKWTDKTAQEFKASCLLLADM